MPRRDIRFDLALRLVQKTSRRKPLTGLNLLNGLILTVTSRLSAIWKPHAYFGCTRHRFRFLRDGFLPRKS
jgi:hypothetical protein